jgi:hypothetical protein
LGKKINEKKIPANSSDKIGKNQDYGSNEGQDPII